MKKLIIGLSLLTIIACDDRVLERSCVEIAPDQEIGCYQIFDPVCGCNGKTYSNNCEATRVGITQFTKGACPEK